MKKQRLRQALFPLLLSLSLLPVSTLAADVHAVEKTSGSESAETEMPVLKLVEKKTHVPWYYLAAVNQYEMGIHWKKNKDKTATPAVSPIRVEIPPEKWSGPINPQLEDHNPLTIRLFGGIGQDGNDDRRADRLNPDDALFAMATWLAREGTSEDAIRRALWDYYQDGIVVDRITGFAHLFQEMGTVDIKGNSFPIPLRYSFTYRSTWGQPRGWGGRRIHEGCDIFAGYGTPVLSTAYGVVEIKGWNRYGGWRIGVRDLNNVYHYYAHLAGFEKGIHLGSLVKPGQVIGYVGSSGYGKPGTSGKFPPHLHFGMYRDTGAREWAFDPTPYLNKWEREARQNARKGKKR